MRWFRSNEGAQAPMVDAHRAARAGVGGVIIHRSPDVGFSPAPISPSDPCAGMPWDELERRCKKLWGPRWPERLREACGVTYRTAARWKVAQRVDADRPIAQMLADLEARKARGLLQEVPWVR